MGIGVCELQARRRKHALLNRNPNVRGASPASPMHEALDERLDRCLDPPRLQPLGGDDRDDVAIGALQVVVDDDVMVIAPSFDLLPRIVEPLCDGDGRNPRPAARALRAIPASRAAGRRWRRRRRRAARAPAARPASRRRTACRVPRPAPSPRARAACRSRCRAPPPIRAGRRPSSSARIRAGRQSGNGCRRPRRNGAGGW